MPEGEQRGASGNPEHIGEADRGLLSVRQTIFKIHITANGLGRTSLVVRLVEGNTTSLRISQVLVVLQARSSEEVDRDMEAVEAAAITVLEARQGIW